MMYNVQILIMPLGDLLDPQGKAVEESIAKLGITGISGVRVGKNISMLIEAKSHADANEKANEAAKELLANPVMESYEVVIV